MTDHADWDALLTLGAAIAEETELRVVRSEDVPVVLASALSWGLLQRFWGGEPDAVLKRWSNDVPDTMSRYAERITIRRI